jgi:hypothetical protein
MTGGVFDRVAMLRGMHKGGLLLRRSMRRCAHGNATALSHARTYRV